jgi:cysteine desulfurase
MEGIHYLDSNATTPLDPLVREAMAPYLAGRFANPSAIYRFAHEVKEGVEEAREHVARLINADPVEIFFTSGGTEADNAAVKGVAYALREQGRHIITSQIEHPAVLNSCEYLEGFGFDITYLPVDKYGMVDPETLTRAMRDDTILISIMYANNEIGTIEPIDEVARIAHEHAIYVHTDAVQATGKIPLDVKVMAVDLLSLSAHKMYGPKGIGALYVRRGVKIDPLVHGGHHERNRRAGTENIPGIIGLGKAAEIALDEMAENERRIRSLRDKLERGILERIPEVIVNGHPEKRLYNTLSVCLKGIEGESILLSLDFEGVLASSGSACSAGSSDPSHVLVAIGLTPEVAHGSLRLSLNKFNTEEDVDTVLEVLPRIAERLRRMSPFWGEKGTDDKEMIKGEKDKGHISEKIISRSGRELKRRR